MTAELSTPEPSRQEFVNKFVAYNLLESANDWMMEQAKNGHKVSLPLAIATRMYLNTEERLSKLPFRGNKQDVGTIFTNLRYQLGQETASEFLYLERGTILKSVLASLERGAVEGWSDGIFIEEVNASIVNTHISQFRSIPSAEDPEDRDVRLWKETCNIREILRNDKTFLGFFPENEAGYGKLPKSMQTFFGKEPVWKAILDSALPIFRETCILQGRITPK